MSSEMQGMAAQSIQSWITFLKHYIQQSFSILVRWSEIRMLLSLHFLQHIYYDRKLCRSCFSINSSYVGLCKYFKTCQLKRDCYYVRLFL